MTEFVKIVRVKNTVVNVETGDVVGLIEEDGVRFIKRVEGKIKFDDELIAFLNDQRGLSGSV